MFHLLSLLQQYLPLAVLKRFIVVCLAQKKSVATVLTACGIETITAASCIVGALTRVATVLTACGIETDQLFSP